MSGRDRQCRAQLKLVPPPAAPVDPIANEPEPADWQRDCIERMTRESVSRRIWLREQTIAEELRLTQLRKRLAAIRNVPFIRAESLEREFKLGIHAPREERRP